MYEYLLVQYELLNDLGLITLYTALVPAMGHTDHFCRTHGPASLLDASMHLGCVRISS